MHDMLNCPICNAKMRTVKLKDKYLHWIDNNANYIERTCTGPNHSIQFFANESNKKIDCIKISLDSKYSKFIEIDFVNQKCRIGCWKAGQVEYINIDKMIVPDFPDLIKLKEKVNMYTVFS